MSGPERHRLAPAVPGVGDERPFANEPPRDFGQAPVRERFRQAITGATLPEPLPEASADAVERAVVLCRGTLIDVEELPPAIRNGDRERPAIAEFPPEGLDFRKAVADYQAHLIRHALATCGGVQRRAARLLGLSPTTLNEMVHRLGIHGERED